MLSRDAPEMNKAEVIHAGWAHRDSPNLSLLDVCHADVRDTLVLEKQLESYKEGIQAPGNGPSLNASEGNMPGSFKKPKE